MAMMLIVLPEKSIEGAGLAVGVAVGDGALGSGVAVAEGADSVIAVAVGEAAVGVAAESLPQADATRESTMTSATANNRCFTANSFSGID